MTFEEWLKKNRDLFRNDLDHHKEGSYRRMEEWLRKAHKGE